MTNWICKTYKTQHVRKTNETFDLLDSSHSFFKRWIIHQLFVNMGIDKYGSIWCINRCLPNASCNKVDEIEMKKCFG